MKTKVSGLFLLATLATTAHAERRWVNRGGVGHINRVGVGDRVGVGNRGYYGWGGHRHRVGGWGVRAGYRNYGIRNYGYSSYGDSPSYDTSWGHSPSYYSSYGSYPSYHSYASSHYSTQAYRDYDDDDYDDDDYDYDAAFTCAPAARTTSVTRVESSLYRLSSTRLSHRPRFETKLKEIGKIRSVKERSEEYLRLAGVRNPSNNRELKRFLSPKADHRANIAAIRDNLQLSDAEARMVYDQVRGALLSRK